MGRIIDSFSGDYAFLSNFYPCEIQFEGLTYGSVEHAFQAAKSLDSSVRRIIREARTAGVAKRLGREVQLRADWESVKVKIMSQLLKEKFSSTDLAEALLATGDAELIEGNTWNDTFWGKCRGHGRNTLGKLLMQHRRLIQFERASEFVESSHAGTDNESL